MLIEQEKPEDVEGIRTVHTAAFASPDAPDRSPAEVGLVDALRADPAWIPQLSLVAVDQDAAAPERRVVGHVCCTRGTIEGAPALALGPLGVIPERQRQGIGATLVHAVLAAADARDEPIVVLLGHPDYYPRLGFRPARVYGIEPPDPEWGDAFQVRPLAAYRSALRGGFVYPAPFDQL